MPKEGMPGGEENNLSEKDARKLAEHLKNNFAEIDLRVLAEQYKGKTTLGVYDPEIPEGASQEVVNKIRRREAMRDLGLFLKMATSFNKHLDMTAMGREKGKLNISPDIAGKLRIILPRIKELISFVKEQNLRKIEKEIVLGVEKEIPSVEIYAQGV